MSVSSEVPQNINPQPAEQPNPSLINRTLDKGKQLLGRGALVLGLATGLVASELVVDIAPPAYADTGGYPDADALLKDISTYTWWKDENGNGRYDTGEDLSSRGFGYRNCTDWAAYEVKQLTGVSVPYGSSLGDAKSWDDNWPWAKTHTPEAGDVAQSDAGTYGHVGAVEKVNADAGGNITSIEVSEYNKLGTGAYSYTTYNNDNGTYWRDSGHTKKWDNFLDPNGVGTGISGSPTEVRPQVTNTIPWNFETMEGDPGSMSTFDADTGKTPATAIFNNQLYTFSYEASGGNLRLAKTAPGWQFSTLDGLGGTNGRRNEDVGQTPAATAYGSSLQVFDYDSTGGNLRHGWSADGTNWNFEDLDGTPGSILGHDGDVGQTPTVVSHSDGSLQLLYFDATNKNLRHAWADSAGWHGETLDGDPNSILGQDTDTGYDPSMVSFNGTLQALYYDKTNGNLRHAWSDSTGWHAETLDGDPNSICGLDSNVGTNPALVVHNNTLQAFYYDEGNKNLRHAWSNSTGWHCETLDGDSNSVLGNNEDLGGMPTAVSMGPTSLNVFAKDMKWGGLRHYWTDSTGWHSEYFDGYGGGPAGRLNYSVGDDPSATNYNGTLQLFYYDNTLGNLRHSIPN